VPADCIVHSVPLVDLGSLHPALPVIALRVLRPFAAGQVYQHQLPTGFLAALPDDHLADGVGAGTGVVGGCGVGSAVGVGLLHDSQQFLCIFCVLLSQSRDLDVAVFILQDVEDVLLVEKVETASTVDLEVAHCHSEVLLRQLVQLVYYQLLQSVHCVGLPRTSLAVGETGHDSLLYHQRQ
jgi:hypothetical protein